MSTNPSDWRKFIIRCMTGESAPFEQFCFPMYNELTFNGNNCGGLGVAHSCLQIYTTAANMIKPGEKVVNIGGGFGFPSRLFFLVSDADVLHIDYDPLTLQAAKLLYPCPGVIYLLHDITTPLPDDIGSYNYIVMTDVIEHIALNNWSIVRDNIYKLLPDGGKILFSFPVGEDLSSGTHSSYHVTSIPDHAFVSDFFSKPGIEIIIVGRDV